MNAEIAERFWGSVEFVDDPNGCWEWRGAVNGSGYGVVTIGGKHFGTHVLAWLLAHPDREIPRGMDVAHICDNRLCCSPNHLRLMNHSQNMRDALLKNRGPNQKIPAKAIPVIRDYLQISTRKDAQKFVADGFGVDRSTISKIASRKRWGWL